MKAFAVTFNGPDIVSPAFNTFVESVPTTPVRAEPSPKYFPAATSPFPFTPNTTDAPVETTSITSELPAALEITSAAAGLVVPMPILPAK